MSLNRKKLYIASHSGVYAGNLIRNTLPSFKAAVSQGSDILEADISMSMDGELYIFHNGNEKLLLHSDKRIKDMDSSEAETLYHYNLFGNVTNSPLNTLDEFLEEFKNKVLLTIDWGWGKFSQIVKKVNAHNMKEQIIFKSSAKAEHLGSLEECGSDFMYIPMVKAIEEYERTKQYNLNVIGAELLFESAQDELVSIAQIERFHKADLLLWGNAIVYDEKAVIGGGFTDDISMTGNPDDGWGKLIDMGFDIIQTDFPGQLKTYIEDRKIFAGKDAV